MAKIEYFYEFDSYTLNRHSRLYSPLSRRLKNMLGKVFTKSNSPPAIRRKDSLKSKIVVQKLNNIAAKLDWKQSLLHTEYVVFDCETTGLHPLRGDRIISIGGVKVEKGEIKQELFEQLIDPERRISRTAREITGITEEMVSGKPTIHEGILEFFDFTEDRILIAHNAAFDLTFLNIALGQLAPLRVPNPVIDTYTLARAIFPDMLDYSLERLASKFNIKIEGRHTAIGDSLVTARIFLHLLEHLVNMEIYTLEQLLDFLEMKKNNQIQNHVPRGI